MVLNHILKPIIGIGFQNYPYLAIASPKNESRKMK